MEVLGIIPARGGSKGIRYKNLALLAGRPLLDYTTEAARKSDSITRFVVSSEDEKIIRYCNSLGVETHIRPQELAMESTPTEPVILNVLQALQDRNEEPQWVFLLQPTSPLRTADDIDSAFKALIRSGADGLISVYKLAGSPYKSFTVDEHGKLRGLVNDRAPFMRRQDCPPVYCANGAIYIFRALDFLKNGKILLDNVIPFVMPAERSKDIDTLEDLAETEAILCS